MKCLESLKNSDKRGYFLRFNIGMLKWNASNLVKNLTTDGRVHIGIWSMENL